MISSNRFHAKRVDSGKNNDFLVVGLPLFDVILRGESPHPTAWNFVAKTVFVAAHTAPQWRFRDPSLNRFDRAAGCANQTVSSAIDKTRLAGYLLSLIKLHYIEQ